MKTSSRSCTRVLRISFLGLMLILSSVVPSSCSRGKEARDTRPAPEETAVSSRPVPEATKPATDLVTRIGDLAADRELFTVKASSVTAKLHRIVELRPGESTQAVWRFTGVNPADGIRWAIADFQPKDNETPPVWTLLQVRIAISPVAGDRQNFYSSLGSEIDRRLHKKGVRTKDNEEQRTAWQVGKYQQISLRDAVIESPIDDRSERVVLVEFAILQGEGEP